MVKGTFVILMSFLLLCACSSQPRKASMVEAIGSEGINIAELPKIEDNSILDGIKPTSYQLDDTVENIMVYDFDSKEKRELGQNRF